MKPKRTFTFKSRTKKFKTEHKEDRKAIKKLISHLQHQLEIHEEEE